MRTNQELIEEAKGFPTLAENVHNETVSLEERKAVLGKLSSLYHNWYRTALTLFDKHNKLVEKQKFEQEYEGSFWSSKIIKFLISGLQVSPLYDPEKPVFDRWTYSVQRCFIEPLARQCNILASLETKPSDLADNLFSEWNATIQRIFRVFVEKANSAKTNHEKKLSYEYLAMFLIGAIDGLTIIGHDERGTSEEIDLWIANEVNDNFWRRHVGDPFIIECKNWEKPTGVTEVRKLLSIMEDKNIQFAVLLTQHGVTGNKYKDATRLIQNACGERRYIVVLDGEDLSEIAVGMHPAEKIKNKFYELSMG